MRPKNKGINKPAKKVVYVGMSGGVDSSVSAAMLQKQGYEVTGVFIKVWQPDWIECNWREERLEAMRVAAHLGIPFLTLDLEQEYKKGVIDYMIAEYAAGRTPNPDVMCNREVKFGAFAKWALAQGADFVATGHYAQVVDASNYNKDVIIGSKTLLAGKDPNKDQSYFLWTLTQDDLKHILFPVGYLLKSEVRALAKKFKLPNAEKKDSQGLCFIGKIDVKEFLKHYIETKPGDVLNDRDEVIGTHPGSLLFTIGERHGFTITKKTPDDAPYFVVAKNVEKNTITVSGKTAQIKNDKEIRISNVSWTDNAPKDGETVEVRGRYREILSKAVFLDGGASQARISFMENAGTATPGQSLVMYKGDVCLGGGIIV